MYWISALCRFSKYKKKQIPKNKVILWFKIWIGKTRRVIKTLDFRLYIKVIIRQNSSDKSLSDNNFEIPVQVACVPDTLHTQTMSVQVKSKIYSFNYSSCFIHLLNHKMTLFFGIFFLYFLNCCLAMVMILVNFLHFWQDSSCILVNLSTLKSWLYSKVKWMNFVKQSRHGA
jgi:hypothetical protein